MDPVGVRISGRVVTQKGSPERKTWDCRSGSNHPFLPAARIALALGEAENAGIARIRRVPALHREAERDTTGSNSRQHPRTYVDWAGRAREASLPCHSHVYSRIAH